MCPFISIWVRIIVFGLETESTKREAKGKLTEQACNISETNERKVVRGGWVH